MYTHKPRTSAEIKADIAELKISIALALDDDRADMESDLCSLYEELGEAQEAEDNRPIRPTKADQAYSGLDEGFLP
jgi:hypothetical protein